MWQAGDRFGRYRLIRQLGRGGFSVVWLAEDADGVRFALKILDPVTGNEELARPLFAREYEALRRVESRNVVQPHDADLHGDPAWIAFRLAGTRTLRDVLAEDPPRPGRPWELPPRIPPVVTSWGEIVAALRGAARGLSALHAAGMTHRDVSPDNIVMVAGDGVLLDLGLVTFGEGGQFSLAQMGKRHYLAPEQWTDSRSYPPSDIWQWGVTACKALTGHLPFPPAPDPLSQQKVLELPPNLRGLPSDDVGNRVEALLLRCLNRDPTARPTAAELVEELTPDFEHGTRGYSPDYLAELHAEVRTDFAGRIFLRFTDGKKHLPRPYARTIVDDMKIRVGDPIWVTGRSGHPTSAQTVFELRTGQEGPLPNPMRCPACSFPLEFDPSGRRRHCPNSRYCPSQVAPRLGLILGTDWYGLERETVDWLFAQGHLSDGSEVLSVPRSAFGDNQEWANTYSDVRERLRRIPYAHRLRHILGMPREEAPRLIGLFPDMRDLIALSEETLTRHGASEQKAHRVSVLLAEPWCRDLIDALERDGLPVTAAHDEARRSRFRPGGPPSLDG